MTGDDSQAWCRVLGGSLPHLTLLQMRMLGSKRLNYVPAGHTAWLGTRSLALSLVLPKAFHFLV